MNDTKTQWAEEFEKEFNQSEICLQDCHPEDKEKLLNFIRQTLSTALGRLMEMKFEGGDMYTIYDHGEVVVVEDIKSVFRLMGVEISSDNKE